MSDNNTNAANKAMTDAFWLAHEADQGRLEWLAEEVQRQLALRANGGPVQPLTVKERVKDALNKALCAGSAGETIADEAAALARVFGPEAGVVTCIAECASLLDLVYHSQLKKAGSLMNDADPADLPTCCNLWAWWHFDSNLGFLDFCAEMGLAPELVAHFKAEYDACDGWVSSAEHPDGNADPADLPAFDDSIPGQGGAA